MTSRRLATRAFALLAALGATALAWSLARVDTGWGEPLGPDRLLASVATADTNDSTAADTSGTALLPPQSDRGSGWGAADSLQSAARQALHDRPVDGRAYRVLAGTERRAGHEDVADHLHAIAIGRWPRDRLARAEMARRALARDDIDAALTHYDALLRVAPSVRGRVLTALAPLLSDERVRAGLVERLAADPPWRGAVPSALLADTTPPRDAEAMLASLARRTEPTPGELQARITLLERLGQPRRARALWLASAGADAAAAQAELFDGGFEQPDIDGGYGWRLDAPAGIGIGHDTGDAVEGDTSLAIAFEGRAARFGGVRQFLAMSPGTYRFAFQARNATDTPRAFAWRIACTHDGRALGEVAIPAAARWQQYGLDFQVPADCPRQELHLRHLARSLAERRASGVLHLDDLGIIPTR